MGEGPARRHGRWFKIGLAALLAAAVVTRFHRLASWPLFGDEFFSLEASTRFSFSLLAPLLYWLNHELVQPFLAMDEFGLRLLPAVFGVVGVAAVVEMGRRVANRRVALWAGLLALLSPWHLAWSQTARSYTLVFALAAVCPAVLYLGVRRRSKGWIAAGVLVAPLAWLAHPTAILPTAGFLVWLAGYALVRFEGRRRRLLLGGMVAAGAAGLAAGWVVLSHWASLGQEWGIDGVWMAVSWGVRLTAGPVLAAAAGVALLWLDGRRELATFLAAVVAVPVALVGLLGELVAVHTGYLFATAPYAFVAGGAFLDRMVRTLEGATLRRATAGAAAAGVVVATGLPSFVSHYVDGGRPDFREAARHVAERAGPGDLVLADQRGPFNYYTPSLETRPLGRDTARIDSLLESVAGSSPSGDLWVAPYIRSEGGFGLRGLGEARNWVWGRCQLSARLDPGRLDHQRNIAEVWRCGAGSRADTGPRRDGGETTAGGRGQGGGQSEKDDGRTDHAKEGAP